MNLCRLINALNKSIVLLSMLLVPFLFLGAQTQSINISGSMVGSFRISPDNYKRDILGTPYLNPDYMYGNLVLSDRKEIEGLFRYNAYAQEIEMVFEKDTFGIAAPFSVSELNLSNKKFIYSLIIDSDFNTDYLYSAFFEVVCDGKYQLLLNHKAVIENNSFATNYMGGGGDGRDYFVHKSSWYYRIGQGTAARKLKRNKRQLMKIFETGEDKVAGFIRDEKINLRSDQDLVKLFTYLNSVD